MAYDDLRDWIKALERAGELKRIRTEADPILEITEITDRVSKFGSGADKPDVGKNARATQPGGSALLVRKPQGLSGPEASHQPVRLGSAACAWLLRSTPSTKSPTAFAASST